jgi:uncharacterized protein involved in tellurium resistance
MASTEPSEEEIQQVLDILGHDKTSDRERQIVIQALKNNNSDVSRVVQEYFDGVDAFRKKYTWDDTMFAGNRDGTANNPGTSLCPSLPSRV